MYTEKKALNAQIGNAGWEYVTSGTKTGRYVALMAINGKAVVANVTGKDSTTIPSLTLHEGQVFLGPITGYAWSSGIIIAY